MTDKDATPLAERLTHDLTHIDWSWTRDDVARIYAQALGHKGIDWPAVNRSIIDNWSRSGLEYVKRKAFGLRARGEVRP